MSAEQKVTYVSLNADSPDVRAGFDAAIEKVRGELGRSYPLRIAGAPRAAHKLLVLMFVFFILGLGAIALAPLY